MSWIEIAVAAAALVLLVPILTLALEVIASVPSRERQPVSGATRPRLAVVVPAHDEAALIGGTVRAILPQLLASDRLLVVADNCSDETAAVAGAAGARVIARNDTSRRGKGYALDFGIRHLSDDPPDVVLIVDADCRVGESCIDLLARTCAATQRPVQALYLMHAPAEAGLTGRIAEFAWILKNRVRPTGLGRLGLPCQLMGTGMAFPWRCIARADLASGHIVEDLKLGLELARDGSPAIFCPQALVTSDFPSSAEGMKSQRTRWEHGYLGVLLQDAPPMIVQSLVRRSLPLLALGLDLSVPPIALLVLLASAVWVAAALVYALEGPVGPLLTASAELTLLGCCVLIGWMRFARDVISAKSLAFAPVYALAKIPLYARFLVARQIDWVRSKRDHERST
ncbi:MAG TPA: glycosyltransferase [Steroidobacteraceae bacterium]|nr:glycosyltransferase [Steroidobacteraceae bacterium]